VREVNEDAFALGSLAETVPCRDGRPLAFDVISGSRGPLFLVCDGMGGTRGGAVASSLAAETIWAEMCEARATDEAAVFARLLRRAIRAANARVREAGGTPGLLGMGTTVSAAGLVGEQLILGQVGDSRGYLLRGGVLTQVTRDQSVVSALVQAGYLTEEEGKRSRQRGVILQALGTGRDVEVSMSIVELRAGDTLLLCSDGVHGPLGDILVRDLLRANHSAEEAARSLIDAAIAAGGSDNATAIIAHFAGGALTAPSPEGDLPRFLEFDPSEEGQAAFAQTSWVARRLAQRAGLRGDRVPPIIPATGPHFALKEERHRDRGPPGRVSQRSIHLWLACIVIALAALTAIGVVRFFER
jgi:protein phosphatase